MTFSRFTLCCCISIAFCAGQATAQQPQFPSQQTGNQQFSNQQMGNQQNQAANNAAAGNLQNLPAAQAPQRPFPQLEADHAQFLDRILDLWQQSSVQVKQYTCDFRRWDFDPTYCNYRDPQDNRLSAFQISDGMVRYANPDKGMFETTAVYDFTREEGMAPEYKPRKNEAQNHEKWICDGKSIYEFDFANKKLYEMGIPAEMQGNGLVNSPLPFLFGVDKQVIKERYWIRVITPQQVQDTEVWLEAFPKNIDDARNYQRLEIILSRTDWMPQMLHIYMPNYDERTNPISRVFQFGNRKINSQLHKFQDVMGFFVRPQTPFGWDRVDRMALADQSSVPPPVNVGQNQRAPEGQRQPRR